jgi:hypothetical protein
MNISTQKSFIHITVNTPIPLLLAQAVQNQYTICGLDKINMLYEGPENVVGVLKGLNISCKTQYWPRHSSSG